MRHPLDAIASLRVGIANNWGHHPRPPDWQQWTTQSLVMQCAHHWAYLNTVAYQAVEHLTEVCKFEEMLSNPYGFAKKVSVDVGFDNDCVEAELLSWSGRVQNTNNEKFIEAKTSRAYSTNDHRTRINRWRENLSDIDLQQIIPIVKEASMRFGYALP